MRCGWRKLYPASTQFVPQRVPAAEYLDDPALPEAHRIGSHRDLERIGRVPFQFGPIWDACRELLSTAAADRDGARVVLELGSGTGHIADRLEEAARRTGMTIQVIRTDRDPPSPEVARLDWLLDPLPSCDVACANLVLHHFSRENAVRALARMHETARLGGVVYDLNRSRFLFELLKTVLPLLASSPVTVADALISVQQAFTPAELLEVARDAGIRSPRVTTHALGCRTRLMWRRP